MSTETVLETLIAAKKLIEDPARVCKGALARDHDGNSCWPSDDAAVTWCATGAVRKAASTFGQIRLAGDALEILDEVSRMDQTQPGDPRPIAKLNDTAPHSQLLAAFDAAIERARTAHV